MRASGGGPGAEHRVMRHRASGAQVLQDVIALADKELGAKIDLDVGQFVGSGGVLGAHAVGKVRYHNPVGEEVGTAKLIVVKLGLKVHSSQRLLEYAANDRGFPYHPTWLQVFNRARFEAYRDLGLENARQAIADSVALKD